MERPSWTVWVLLLHLWILPLMAHPTRHSIRTLHKPISFLSFMYSLLIVPFISQSPRWLAIRGRVEEATEILSKYARLKGKKLPENVTVSFPSEAKLNADNDHASISSQESLWSRRWARKRIILVMIAGWNWVCVLWCCVYFMHIFSSNSGKISKGSLGQLIAESLGFMAVSTAFDVLYIYCVELFPTNMRNIAVSMLRQALMLGAAIAPVLVVLGRLSPSVSFLVFGGWPFKVNCSTFANLKQEMLLCMIPWSNRERRRDCSPAFDPDNGLPNFSVIRCF